MFRGVVRKDGPPASGGVWPHLPEPPPGCSGVPLGRCGLVSPADKSHPHPCRQRAGRLGFKQQPQHPPPARGPAPRGTCPPSSPQCGSARCGPPPVPPVGVPAAAAPCGPLRSQQTQRPWDQGLGVLPGLGTSKGTPDRQVGDFTEPVPVPASSVPRAVTGGPGTLGAPRGAVARSRCCGQHCGQRPPVASGDLLLSPLQVGAPLPALGLRPHQARGEDCPGAWCVCVWGACLG